MKESFCGLCDKCRLDHPDFLEAVARVKSFVDEFPAYWWMHCFPGEEGFSLPEFVKGLEWFLRKPECPGCKEGGGREQCPIRRCALRRQCANCFECPELETCEHYSIIFKEGYENYLHRFLLRVRKVQ